MENEKDLQVEAYNENAINELLDKTGLNWTVSKEAMVTKDSGIAVPKKVALVRSDTQRIVSVMGAGYEPFMNHELLELLYRVSQMTGFDVVRGGSFGEGGKVYFQMKSENLPLTIVGGKKDTIEGYLTGINSFDGSTSLAFGASNKTISCQNTFYSAFRELENKARHTKNMRGRVDDICRGLEQASIEEARIFNDIKLLNRSDFDQNTKDMVIRKLFNIKSDVDLNDTEAISTRTRNAMDAYKVDSRSEIDDKGETMWGLFSGVTKYTTHTVGKNNDKYDSNAKMYNFYGKREQAIFHELVNLSGIGS